MHWEDCPYREELSHSIQPWLFPASFLSKNIASTKNGKHSTPQREMGYDYLQRPSS